MKNILVLTLLFCSCLLSAQSYIQPENNEAFMQEDLAEVWIELDDTDLSTLLGDSLYTDHYFQATFSYVSSSYSKVMEGVGFRVRGNTSRNANKKSFKV